jgi:hypothetical protein
MAAAWLSLGWAGPAQGIRHHRGLGPGRPVASRTTRPPGRKGPGPAGGAADEVLTMLLLPAKRLLPLPLS